MKTTDVELSKLVPPSTRPVADAAKVVRMGAFDWAKYTPIIVEQAGNTLTIQDGMTRVEAARRAGMTSLPAYVFAESEG